MSIFDWRAASQLLLANVGSAVQPADGILTAREVQELLLKPETAAHVWLTYRPVLADLVAQVVDDLCAGIHATNNAPLVAIALTDILVLAPYLQGQILKGLAHYMPPVGNLVQDLLQGTSSGSDLPWKLSIAVLRLLTLCPNLKEVKLLVGIENLLICKAANVRWAGIQIVAAMYSLSDASKDVLVDQLVGKEMSVRCFLEWRKDEARLAGFQSALWNPSPAHFGSRPDTPSAIDTSVSQPAPKGFTRICNVLLPCKDRQEVSDNSQSPELVMTPGVKESMQGAAMALCTGQAVLFEGPPGSGKSAMLDALGRATGNADYLTIHVDDQMDSKSLLGTYIASSVAGEFTWQPGLLCQAVQQGKWLVIEDINLAPPDLLAALIPLLESGRLHLSQRAETIEAAPGFQLFATVTCSPGRGTVGAYGDSQSVRNLLGSFWSIIHTQAPRPDEQSAILAKLYPQLPHVVLSACLAALKLCQKLGGDGFEDAESDVVFPGWQLTLENAQAAAGLRNGELAQHFGRYFSLRDVLKLCKRLEGVRISSRSEQLKGDMTDILRLPMAYREQAMMETVDCFGTIIANHEVQHKLCAGFAYLWGLDADLLDRLSQSKPEIEVSRTSLRVGRALLPRLAPANGSSTAPEQGSGSFAPTAQVMRTMQSVAVAVLHQEPTLLVGETGTGKTTLVQKLADQVGAKIVVLNLSQQTESSDLLGGFRPVPAGKQMMKLLSSFYELFSSTFTRGKNEAFLNQLRKLAQKERWQNVVQAFHSALAKVAELEAQQVKANLWSGESVPEDARSGKRKKDKRKQIISDSLRERWSTFRADLARLEKILAAAESGAAFAFEEGTLVKALRDGLWLLLDEINLAPPEALERISGILEGSMGSILLAERGDVKAIQRHPNFHLLAAMNPATDVGKVNLPVQLRQKFTEIYVPEMTAREDLQQLVLSYLWPVTQDPPADAVVDFYLAARKEAVDNLQDSSGERPSYNLRTLSRALEYTAAASGGYGLKRALYDGFSMSFMTQLNTDSAQILQTMLATHLLSNAKPKEIKAMMARAPQQPKDGVFVLFEHFWVEAGPEQIAETSEALQHFVITPSISMHLCNLARAVLLRRYPILLQGPTSSGKTTLVSYLAAKTGHRCVRINNHEGTDLQEYLGSYITDEQGRLVFREGALVTALRKGHWIVLDELNLAPSEVLEALNRLLDDNRELFVPELQEFIQPHPQFMLFATQNPAGAYAGRKSMSRAFKSRFLELHVADIPEKELTTILHERCSIAPSHADKLVATMSELHRNRQGSDVFAGKHGLITPRDLFKWAQRGAVTYQHLAENGFMLLGERLRAPQEQAVVQQTLEKVMNVKLDMRRICDEEGNPHQQLQARLAQSNAPAEPDSLGSLRGIVWTPATRRMYTLLNRCLENSEAALLVGETGTGKTTVCQSAALLRGQKLHILNCNLHTEASDFLGGYRPSRNRSAALLTFKQALESLRSSPAFANRPESDSLDAADGLGPIEIRDICKTAKALVAEFANLPSSDQSAVERLLQDVRLLEKSAIEAVTPFEWMDGPLVTAMRNGDIILIDELNLAEDAVLERLNSVLEAGRTLTLAEKGGAGAEEIKAAPGFRLVATMNPGGDFGKRELSPALANRFTTIWVPAFEDLAELRSILALNLNDPEEVLEAMLQFWQFFKENAGPAKSSLSVRDLLAWTHFINTTAKQIGSLAAYVHGAQLVLLDGIGLGIGMPIEAVRSLLSKCQDYLRNQLPATQQALVAEGHSGSMQVSSLQGATGSSMWGIEPFYIQQSNTELAPVNFAFQAKTTSMNVQKVLRAMQLTKAILLEGSPGVGKTSLIAAIAKATGHKLVRINLSEQTDIMDLLGADLPSVSGQAGDFAWSDGPLLAALKAGDWVLLDELNLAGQSVLEGLNAMLDHRGEIFIAELCKTFQAPPGFRIFAAQNPIQEGGGRRGLPKSFLNRFTKVFIDLLQPEDLVYVAGNLHPAIPQPLLERMVSLLNDIHQQVNVERSFGSSGSPWEFNLRDLLRWCHLMEDADPPPLTSPDEVALHFLQMLIVQRFRSSKDRQSAERLAAERGFCKDNLSDGLCKPSTYIQPDSLTIGWAKLDRQGAGKSGLLGSKPTDCLLNSQLGLMESVGHCIQENWPVLLTGSQGTGKTTVIRSLAKLCNAPLVEIALTAGTDTSELLGGFEQLDLNRRMQHCKSKIHLLVQRAVKDLILSSSADTPDMQAVDRLSSAWRASYGPKDSPTEQVSGLSSVLRLVESNLQAASEEDLSLQAEIEAAWQAISDLHSIHTSQDAAQTAGRFEWIDGMLTKAIEEGSWVLLENSNLCNPTVLDRLNPLLEPNGNLLLNEAGSKDGELRILTAHPNFRLFLTMDPRHGEVSRAMRNRCIELSILSDSQALHAASISEQPSPKDSDLLLCLGAEQVAGDTMAQMMLTTHCQVVTDMESVHESGPGEVTLKSWARACRGLGQQGWSFADALSVAFNEVYVRRCSNPTSKAKAQHAFDVCCGHLTEAIGMPGRIAGQDCLAPAACRWPHPQTLSLWHGQSALATLARDSALLESLFYELCLSQETTSEDTFSARPNKGSIIQTIWPAANAFCERTSGSEAVLRVVWASWMGSELQQITSTSEIRSQVCQAVFQAIKSVLHVPHFSDLNEIAGGCWQTLRMAVWRAVSVHVLLAQLQQRMAPHSDLQADFSPLEMAYWRKTHIEAKLQSAAAHPVIDALPVLVETLNEAISRRLEDIVAAGKFETEHVADVCKLEGQLHKLCHTTHGRLTHETEKATLAQFLQPFLYEYQEMYPALHQTCIIWTNGQETCAYQKLLNVLDYTNSCLAWDGLPAPPSLLWLHAGHPVLPRSLQLHDLSTQLDRILALMNPAMLAGSFEDQDWSRETLQSLGTRSGDGAANDVSPAELTAALIAALSVEDRLKEDLLQGYCLFQLAAHRATEVQAVNETEHLPQETSQAESLAFALTTRLVSFLAEVRGAMQSAAIARAEAQPAAFTWRQMLIPAVKQMKIDLIPLEVFVAHVEELEMLSQLTHGLVCSGGSMTHLAKDSFARVDSKDSNLQAASTAAWRRISWLLSAPDNLRAKDPETGRSLLQEQATNLCQQLWTVWLADYSTGLSQTQEELLVKGFTPAVYTMINPRRLVIENNQYKLLQLRLALEHMNRWSTAVGSSSLLDQDKHECASVRCLLAQILAAHAPSSADPNAVSSVCAQLADNSGSINNTALAETVLQAAGSIPHKVFAELLQPLFKPCIEAVSSPLIGAPLGEAWCQLGLLRLHLLAAWPAVDPALKPEIEMDAIHATLNDHLEPELKVRHLLQQLPAGPDESQIIQRLQEEISSARTLARGLKGKTALRPKPSHYATLRQQVQDFPQSTASVARLQEIISGLKAGEPSTMQLAEFFQQSAVSFVSGLEKAYPLYIDLIYPIKQAVLEIAHGLRKVCQSVMTSEFADTSNLAKLAAFPTPPELVDPGSRTRLDTEILSGRSGEQKQSAPEPQQNLVHKRLELLRVLLTVKAKGDCTKPALAEESRDLFDQLLAAWEAFSAAEAAKAEEEAEMFKSKTRETNFKSEEEEDEEAYKQMFPDFGGSFKEFANAPNEFMDTASEDEMPEVHHNSREAQSLLRGHLLSHIVSLHQRMFGGRAVAGDEDWKGDFEQCYDSISPLVQTSDAGTDAVLASAHLLKIALLHAKLDPNTTRLGDLVDVQKPVVAEILLLQEPVLGLLSRLQDLLEEWPENPLLEQLSAMCRKLLGLPVESPLKAAMTGVELLVDRAQLWEQSAARHVSVATHLEQLLALARRWRQYELSSWRLLAARVRAASAEGAHKSWFHLYRIIIADQADNPAAFQETATVLEQFLQTASLGEFERRLEMIATFRLHAASLDAKHGLVALLENMHAYYSQYLPHVLASLQAGLDPINKHLQDFVKLAKWEDRGQYAQAMQAEKSQRQLHKMMRDAQEVLKRPAGGVIGSVSAAVGSAAHLQVAQDDRLEASRAQKRKPSSKGKAAPEPEQANWLNQTDVGQAWRQSCSAMMAESGLNSLSIDSQPDSNSHKLQDRIPQLTSRLSTLLEPVCSGRSREAKLSTHLAGAEGLEELSGLAAQSASELRSLTSKTARLRKKMALVDFLQALNRQGFSHRRSAVPVDERTVHSWFMKPSMDASVETALQGTLGLQDAGQDLLRKAHKYYNSSIMNVQRLWESVKQPSQDLSALETERMLHLSEHMLHLQVKQRASLLQAANEWQSLQQSSALLAGFQELCSLPHLLLDQEAAFQWIKKVDTAFAALAQHFQETVQLLTAVSSANKSLHLQEANQVLKAASVRITISRASLCSHSSIMQIGSGGIRVVTPLALNVASMCCQDLRSIHNDLSSKSTSYANSVPCWQWLIDQLDTAACACQPPTMKPVHAAQVHTSNYQEKLEAAIENILLWTQSTLATDEALAGSSDTQEATGPSIGAAMAAIESQMSLSKLRKTKAALAALLQSACQQDWTPEVAKQLNGLRMMSNMVSKAVQHLLSQYLQLHKSTSKLTYISSSIFASLLKEGFCTAEETEDNTDGQGGGNFQETEGTGMGEGEGGKDISDQIENEDQLLGAKQKDAPEEQDKGEQELPDEGQKGIEMEGDFDGQYEDIPPNSDDSADEEQEGDEERLQQEMGDVGDTGETVDERLWNENDKPEENQQGPEKREKDSTVQVDDKSKLDYEGGGEDGDQGQQEQQPPQNSEQQEGENGEDPADGDEEGQINDDAEDKYEERQFARPKDAEQGQEGQEDMDLPEDMNLDNMDDADGGAAEEDQPESGPQDTEMQPQNLQDQGLNSDEPDQGQNADSMEGPEQPEDQANLSEEDDPEGQDGPGEALDEDMTPAEEAQDDQDYQAAASKESDKAKQKDQAPEAGPSGKPSSATLNDQGGEGRQKQGKKPEETDGWDIVQEAQLDAAGDAKRDQGGRAEASQRGGVEAQSGTEDAQAPKPKTSAQEQPNPYHSLGSAMEKWRAQLNITGEETADDGEADIPTAEDGDEEPIAEEYAYLPENAAEQRGDTQALAAATEEQARQSEVVQPQEDKDSMQEADEAVQVDEREEEELPQGEPKPAEQTLKSSTQAGAQRVMDLEPATETTDLQEEDAVVDAEMTDVNPGAEEDDTRASHSVTIQDVPALQQGEVYDTELSEEQAAQIRARMDAALHEAAPHDDFNLDHGRKMWSACEALTSGLAGELTEQLRLLLEPTKASRLAGDYRSGKRISMRKVVAYIASHYRKDKIWLRRTRPDKRQYQVVLAIDDSKSMRENGCGTFAVEAVALISKALSRLEVGEVGIVRFGGADSTKQLHPLDKPFTDEDGPKLLAQLQFDQDNTIADRPMMDLIVSLRHMLEGARQRMSGGSMAQPALHQLVLIMSDGRFHEKESLRRAVLEASADKGTLLAFIALDNSAKSLLDMQTVSFVGGKPVFNKYLDTFPFPFYILLRDITALPRTLADLLRQWIQLSTA